MSVKCDIKWQDLYEKYETHKNLWEILHERYEKHLLANTGISKTISGHSIQNLAVYNKANWWIKT